MTEAKSLFSWYKSSRSRMSLCIQLSVIAHTWVFIGVSSNAQAQALRSEKAELFQALAYARRAGIDVAAYQQSLKEAPFLPGFETRSDLARAAHAKMAQMLDQVNREISQGDPDQVASRRDSVLIVNSGDNNIMSHSLFVSKNGTIEYSIDNHSPGIGISSQHSRTGGKTGILQISTAQASRLFDLATKHDLQSLHATALLPDRDDGNYLVNQYIYLDFEDKTSPNLLCASSIPGQQLVACCKEIEQTLKMQELAHSH